MFLLVGILLSTTIITNLASYEGYQDNDSYYAGDGDVNYDRSFENPDVKLETRQNKIAGKY